MLLRDDAVALVTGGAQGIGQACVRALADAGARVVVFDRNGDGAVDRFGRLDVLVHTAGSSGRSTCSTSTNALDTIISINLKGTFLSVQITPQTIHASAGEVF